MATIQILSEQIANQIAAGEVVEGPSSIVKELVENSIDAGSNKIHVEVSRQFQKIEVIDNGSGINPDELGLAFKRHATSKIQTVNDIYNLFTNGFRGEALASISAVAKVSCISKRKIDDTATKIYIENGKEVLTKTGAGDGTTIIVDDIFFNVPARLKFLKSNNKERNNIIDLIRAFAIANPKIAFTLKVDEKILVKTTGSDDLEACVDELFTQELRHKLCKLNCTDGDISLIGYVSAPELTRTDKRGIFTFLNGRVIQCNIMRAAIDAVYRKYLTSGKYPIVIINLVISPDQVDVNVHPSKKEVKYQNPNLIYRMVGDAVAKAISDSFYLNQNSFQPSLDDHNLQTEPKPQQIIFESYESKPIAENFDSYKFKPEALKSFPVKDYEEKISANNRQFISRFGSVDISVFDSTALETTINSMGSRTNFELVIKDVKFAKSVLLKGDFVGENWLKEKYLNFLGELGKEILDKEKSEYNFSSSQPSNLQRSRPDATPSQKELEAIWQRDNYTCVYCAKALLHPSTIKNALKDCNDIALLNSHLASYDHHLPASKFPVLNEDKRNLYAVCQECNIKKSDSLASKTWTPVIKNSWDKPLLVSNLSFDNP